MKRLLDNAPLPNLRDLLWQEARSIAPRCREDDIARAIAAARRALEECDDRRLESGHLSNCQGHPTPEEERLVGEIDARREQRLLETIRLHASPPVRDPESVYRAMIALAKKREVE